MTDSVCDSWEDVDVDNIVIKPSSKKKNAAAASSSNSSSTAAAAGTGTTAASAAATSSFTIEENGGSIVVNSNLNANAIEFQFRPRTVAATAAEGAESRCLNYAQACSSNSSRPSLLPTPPSSTMTAVVTSSNYFTSSSPFDDQGPRVVLEDDTRTQFVPRLRILNRPNADRSDQDAKALTTEERNQALMRSYAEKRAEYAKARLRILGEEMPKEESSASISLSEMKEALDAPKNSTSSSSVTSTPLLPTPPSLSNAVPVNTNVIRQPAAPDGTRGFKSRARS